MSDYHIKYLSMNKAAVNTFSDGLITDLAPLSTPRTVLTDCLNGTIITYNGNEFSLQNDMGNVKMDNIYFPTGYVPVGMKEYGGVIYVALYSPSDNKCEIGSFPSPKTITFGENETKQVVSILNTDVIDQVNHEGIKILKPLFEMIDKLNPGDQFKIEIIKTGASQSLFDESSPSSMFDIKYFYQTEDGKITPVEKSDINITDQNGLFSYFKGTSGSIILVSYEIKKPDYFNVNITAPDSQTINISAKGSHKTANVFKGFELKVKYASETVYITKNYELPIGTYNNVLTGATIENIAATDDVNIEITPYSDYCYYRDMTVKRSFSPEQIQQMSSSLNNIFKYYIDGTNLKIDFNFFYPIKNLDLFVEVYDPWSDCSTVKKIDDPTAYGLNTVLFDLVEIERKKEVSPTRGGISLDNLDIKLATDYQQEKYHAKIPTGESLYITKSTDLRKNHFYIVRISCVELNPDNTYKYSDFFKSLYTSTIMNNYYNAVDDFETIKLNLSNIIAFNYKINSDSIIQENNNYGYDESTNLLMTDGNPYKISDTAISSSYFYYNEFINKKKVNFDITYSSESMFGDFNESLISTTSKDDLIANANQEITLGYSDDFNYVSKIGSTISSPDREQGKSSIYINSDDITKSGLNYDININYKTYRNISSEPVHTYNSITSFKEIPIRKTLLTAEDISGSIRFDSNYINTKFNHPSVARLDTGSTGTYYVSKSSTYPYYTINHYGGFDDDLDNLITYWRNNFRSNICAFISNITVTTMHFKSTFQEETLDGEKYLVSKSDPNTSAGSWKKCMLSIMRPSDKITTFLRTHSYADILEFFNNVYVCSINSGNKNMYSPGTINNITSGTTSYSHSLKIAASLIGDNVNIFNFSSAKDGFATIKAFNATGISSFISHLDKLSVVGNQLGSNVELYPILNSSNSVSTTIDIPISDYKITKSSNPVVNNSILDIVNTWSRGADLLTNAISSNAPASHGELYIKDNKNIKLKNLINNIRVSGLNDNSLEGIEITDTNFWIYYEPRDKVTHSGTWHEDSGAPNMIDDYIYS